jgi:hypothetical protein
MAASTASFVNRVQKIRAQYPKDLQETLARYGNGDQTDAPAYQEFLMETLYKQFICRLDPCGLVEKKSWWVESTRR